MVTWHLLTTHCPPSGKIVSSYQVNPVPPEPKEEKPVSTKHTVEAHETPKPALKRGHTKKNDACAAAAEAPPTGAPSARGAGRTR